MRKALLSALLIGIVLTASATQAAVTVDPNAPGAQRQAAPVEDVDARLAQKISYDSGYKRLHAVVEDLSKMSGVSIACGSSTRDWRVRDVPVFVFVKDMPLGKLLRALADATHTWFASQTVADKSAVKTYRIYRRAKEEAEIDSLLQNRHEVKMAQANWQWDAMLAYGKTAENTDFVKEDEMFRKPLWPIAKLIASLGSDSKSRMLSGETFRFRGSDPVCKEVVNDLYQMSWNSMLDGMGDEGKTAPPPTRKDAETAELSIKLMDTGDSGDTEIQVNLTPMIFGRVQSGWTTTLSNAQALNGAGLKLPPYPRDTQTPSAKDDIDNPEMVPISRNRTKSMDYPLLQAKIDIEKPDDLKDPTFTDAFRALAKASGCNMVAEDFLSHMAYRFQQMDYMFKNNASIADLFHYPISGGVLDYKWFFNEGDKLLVGWADDSGDRSWRDHHRNLVSEASVTDLRSKLDGRGVGLDDAAALMTMPRKSFDEWIFHSRDFGCLSQIRGASEDEAWWKLYESLGPADKAAAKSDDGLPLAKFDPEWIAASSRAQKLMTSAYVGYGSSTDEEQQQREAERKLKERVTTDPRIIVTMVMRIKSSPASTRLVTLKRDGHEIMTGGVIPPELRLFGYRMEIGYKVDGKDAQMVIHGPNVPLPVMSAEREAELLKKQAPSP